MAYIDLFAVAGSLTLVLEDGTAETVTEPGSVIVQRGTLHRWENRSDGWVKFVAVMIDAKPVEIKDVEGNTVETLVEGFNLQH
jgi:quercetin dioxygenase-like cupin family protein